MKNLFFASFMFFSLNTTFADLNEPKAIIHSIDDYEYPYNDVEVSEEALPSDLYQELLQQGKLLRFTPISEAKARTLFERFERDPRARMKSPGGFCSTRRAYVQNVLRGMKIASGKIVINCPGNNGRLRFRDQVSGRYFSYSNFHDANVVLVKTPSGNFYRVMDVQFQSKPVSLNAYLAQLEPFQRIQPTRRNAEKAGICYWSISSPRLTR